MLTWRTGSTKVFKPCGEEEFEGTRQADVGGVVQEDAG